MISKHIKALEKRLKTGKEFSKVVDYFLTYLGENKKFMDESVPLEEDHEIILAVVGKIAEGIFASKPQIEHSFLSRFPDSDLIHGTLVISKHLSNVIFFEKSDIGLFIIPLPDGHIHFFRFSTMTFDRSEVTPHYGNIFGSHGIKQ
ncbi:MAG: hypothetical protein ROO73_04290 [Roseivirga sp.]